MSVSLADSHSVKCKTKQIHGIDVKQPNHKFTNTTHGWVNSGILDDDDDDGWHTVQQHPSPLNHPLWGMEQPITI